MLYFIFPVMVIPPMPISNFTSVKIAGGVCDEVGEGFVVACCADSEVAAGDDGIEDEILRFFPFASLEG